ncbi:MAG: MotA/TolQ/ExbB proton channel family protein [Lachnospiraceae bacterium]|nr:MotA/TolQ/ExbB proton channel family protein [Lachnospiraceae bacterium]
MKGLFRSKLLLILFYIMMLAVCVYLNFTSEKLDMSNLIISGVMFAIVLLIFLFAFVRFAKTDSMIRDLNNATAQIKDDFRARKQYLWSTYKTRESLFMNKTLARRYKEYLSEVDRLGSLSDGVYKSDIEDYINQDLLDDTIRRNVLNLVSGTMTGLGILGTFIGLSIGLQAFNTGTAQEITDSIGPLIQGIKVAFHTSIYGMVFGLTFSFLYKGKLDQATEALNRFLNAYDNYVLPDSKNENLSQMLAFQKKQAEGMNELADAMGSKLAATLGDIMTPQFNRMNTTITNFAAVATQAQLEGIENVVDKFVEQMNQSLQGAFVDLGRSMTEMVEWQRENRSYMRSILEEVGTLTTDLTSMTTFTQQAVEHMASYMEGMETMQQDLRDSIRVLQDQMETGARLTTQQQGYIETLVGYEKKLSESTEAYAEKMTEQLTILRRMEQQLSETTQKHMEEIAQLAQQSGETMTGAAQYAADTAAQAARTQMDNMVSVADVLNGDLKKSSEELQKSAERLEQNLADSVKSTYGTIDEMQKELKGLIYSVDVLRRSTSALEKLQK